MKPSTLVFLGLLLGLAQALDSVNCKKIECGSAGTNTCMTYANNVVTLGSCNSGYECPDDAEDLLSSDDDDYETYSCVAETSSNNCNGLGLLSAGRTCCNNGDCASGTCTGSTCQGVESGAACTMDEACMAGYYCSGSVCTERTKSDGDTCTKDEECPVGSGCNFTTCVELVSLSTGASADEGKFCKSGYAYLSKCDEVIVKIAGEEIDEPFSCDLGQVCDYYLKEANIMI